ncbi:hypothetical protein PR048_014562 [Dryococelus australis]|uniref:Uncharacterized protein n=1 Tax=Dryococelus australis TaxID=614101 RepID=A0ABQ9HEK5_9NEOP|nr:hypothetical protein PR048_014562 [Dryococelus australis]
MMCVCVCVCSCARDSYERESARELRKAWYPSCKGRVCTGTLDGRQKAPGMNDGNTPPLTYDTTVQSHRSCVKGCTYLFRTPAASRPTFDFYPEPATIPSDKTADLFQHRACRVNLHIAENKQGKFSLSALQFLFVGKSHGAIGHTAPYGAKLALNAAGDSSLRRYFALMNVSCLERIAQATASQHDITLKRGVAIPKCTLRDEKNCVPILCGCTYRRCGRPLARRRGRLQVDGARQQVTAAMTRCNRPRAPRDEARVCTCARDRRLVMGRARMPVANWPRFAVGSLPDYRMWESCPDDAAGWRVFSGISRFPCPCIPALLHARVTSTASTLTTPTMLRCPDGLLPMCVGPDCTKIVGCPDEVETACILAASKGSGDYAWINAPPPPRSFVRARTLGNAQSSNSDGGRSDAQTRRLETSGMLRVLSVPGRKRGGIDGVQKPIRLLSSSEMLRNSLYFPPRLTTANDVSRRRRKTLFDDLFGHGGSSLLITLLYDGRCRLVPCPSIPALLHSRLISPSSALETSLLRAGRISQLRLRRCVLLARHFLAETDRRVDRGRDGKWRPALVTLERRCCAVKRHASPPALNSAENGLQALLNRGVVVQYLLLSPRAACRSNLTWPTQTRAGFHSGPAAVSHPDSPGARSLPRAQLFPVAYLRAPCGEKNRWPPAAQRNKGRHVKCLIAFKPEVLKCSIVLRAAIDIARFGQRFCRPYSDRVNVTSPDDAAFRTRPRPQGRPNVYTA